MNLSSDIELNIAITKRKTTNHPSRNKDNVTEAIDYVQPFGLDLCSSVRTNGRRDEDKLKAFFKAAG